MFSTAAAAAKKKWLRSHVKSGLEMPLGLLKLKNDSSGLSHGNQAELGSNREMVNKMLEKNFNLFMRL